MKQQPKQHVTQINLPGDYLKRRANLKTPTVALLTLVSVALLSAAQQPVGWSWLAWCALTPWALAVATARNTRAALLITYLAALAYYLLNLYWLTWVTFAGYLALACYLAAYFPLIGSLLRAVYLHRRWPFTLVLPLLWVAHELGRATLLTGFPWFFLAHSQHDHTMLIQIADLTGAYGVTFLIAMVNGFICDLLLRPVVQGKNTRTPQLSTARLFMLTTLVLLACLVYGHFRLNQGQKTISPGDTIALVQDAIPQHVKASGASDEDIFASHLATTQAALAATPKPSLIVWPETMVPAPLNQNFLALPQDFLTDAGKELQAAARDYDKQLKQIAAKNTALLVGAAGLNFTSQGQLNRYNSAFLYLPSGKRFNQYYSKMHLVPFGEVVPFKKSWPWLHNLLNSLTPYDHDYSLTAGQQPTIFRYTARDDKTYRFAVPICYEDVMPQIPRQLAAPIENKKRVDFLLNISNDGWFVTGGRDKPVKPSAELSQHLAICQFRAVENRIPIARAVNTGISAFIRPDGSLQQNYLAGSLPKNATERQAVAGFITDTLHLDSRVAPYNRIGDAFALACTALATLILLDALLQRFRPRKKNTH